VALALTAVVGALLAACGADSSPPSRSPSPSGDPSPSASVERCGQDFLDGLDQRERLAQLLMVGVTGTADAVSVVKEQRVGGVFIGGWTDPSMLDAERIAEVQDAGRTPVMIAIDEEGGRVSRVGEKFGIMPSARRSAQTMSVDEVREMARERGRELAELGITVDFAPVVDVSDEPDGGAIGDRSYSGDPDTVTAYATAFAEGMDDAGVLPVIKHFPGHGHASGDSHAGLVTTPPLSSLLKSDLVPYRKMIGSVPLAVMVGHLEVPELTEQDQPASLSPRAIDLLRTGHDGQWRAYDGVIFTDDLSGMKAITDGHSVPEAVELALAAGDDVALWLTTDETSATLDHLEAAVAAGDLDSDQIDASVLRVARAKGLIDCDPGRP